MSEGPDRNEARLARLLCSRICHDLVSPSGAINTGLELMADPSIDAATTAEAKTLVKSSGQQLAARLSFFRAAFGSGTKVSRVGDVVTLVREFLAGGSVRIDGPETAGSALALAPEGVQAALGLLLVTASAPARGGLVSVAAAPLDEGVGIAMVAEGKGARLAPEVLAAMTSDVAFDQITPRNVHAFLAAATARAAGGTVEVAPASEDRVEIALIVPAG